MLHNRETFRFSWNTENDRISPQLPPQLGINLICVIFNAKIRIFGGSRTKQRHIDKHFKLLSNRWLYRYWSFYLYVKGTTDDSFCRLSSHKEVKTFWYLSSKAKAEKQKFRCCGFLWIWQKGETGFNLIGSLLFKSVVL